MKANSKHGLIIITTTLAATTFIAASSFAETPMPMTEGNSGQMMQQQGMPGGMGPGGMGPGAMGQGRMGAGGMGMMIGGMSMMQALNLDKDQRAKLRGMQREERVALCKTKTEMLDIRDELATEYDKNEPDPKAVGKLYSKLFDLQRHMIEQSVQMRNKMRGMLNKDQKQTFDGISHGGMMGNGMMGNGMMGNGMMGNGMMGNGMMQ